MTTKYKLESLTDELFIDTVITGMTDVVAPFMERCGYPQSYSFVFALKDEEAMMLKLMLPDNVKMEEV